MKRRFPLISSSQPDPHELDRVAYAQGWCLIIAAAIAAAILLAWWIPVVGAAFPHSWKLMKANTAAGILLGSLSFWLSQPEHEARAMLMSRLSAGLLILLAAASGLEYFFHVSIGIDTWLARDAGALQPGRMSPQTAIAFLLLGGVALFLRVRKRLFARLVDVLALCLGMLVMVVLAGYLFGALELFGFSMENRMSPHTLLALTLLCFVAFSRRAEYGIFSVLLGVGIGSRISRIACPVAILMPFALASGRILLTRFGILRTEYSTALATSISSLLAFCLIAILAWRINDLERDVQDLSLRDELTQLYNRRGFYVLGEQMLRLTRRSGAPFSVLFLDLDDLKLVNDTLGHEVGSECLRRMAELLTAVFRESDVIGRVGGDEFVVTAAISEIEIRLAALRLEDAAERVNATSGSQYAIRFSWGIATCNGDHRAALEDLLTEADARMYEVKREKKNAHQFSERYSPASLPSR